MVIPYVGIPFHSHSYSREALHCYGLVVIVYEDVLGIKLPTHYDAAHDDYPDIERAYLQERDTERWVEVPAPQEFDIIMLRIYGAVSHCGIIVAPGKMLHVAPKREACIESYRSGAWAKRIAGYYRHAERVKNGTHRA